MQLKENTFFGDKDRYKLIELLGSGGYSEVWLANDTTLSANVALKVYAPGRGLDDRGVELFKYEFNTVMALNHPNLVRLLHFEVYERMPYLIMPYYERGSTIVLVGAINEAVAWKFLHDVASGLDYLHKPEPPLIHQDIKPDNILIDNENNYLIADFGISSRVQNTLRQSVPSQLAGAGTKSYMAPERFSAGYQPIKASDIWSLGASLYEFMTGYPPFLEHGGSVQTEEKGITDIAGNWHPDLKDIVKRCLHFNTWDRPTAKEIVEIANYNILNPQRSLKNKPEVKTEDPIEIGKTTQQEPNKNRKNNAGKPASPVKMILSLAAAMIIGLCAGYFFGNFMQRIDPKIKECITIIEQGDALFDENNLSTWRVSLAKYMVAKDMIEQDKLPLPRMDFRINRLKGEIDQVVNTSIENAKQAFKVNSEMALFNLNEALELDPNNQEAKTLLEQYTSHFNSLKR
ncbi:MAG: serine/threonine protein kinase [Tannerella sp.]|jgi:serine/threonine protein kinase|nr:serine/threonine protein kinase [Tannerella sp.]